MEVEKEDGPFFCPSCRGKVILKKGRIKIPHFAHKPPVTCIYGKGESEIHYKAKLEIRDELERRFKKGKYNIEVEKFLGKVRPDVYFEKSDKSQKFAIEIQKSNLTIETIEKRTKEYNNLGIYVLWLPLYSEREIQLREEQFRPKSWEKWLHTLNYGAIYYWTERLKFKEFKFESEKVTVPYKEWYDEDGELRSVASYEKTLKSQKKPIYIGEYDIGEDMGFMLRGEFKAGKITIPKCKIIKRKQK